MYNYPYVRPGLFSRLFNLSRGLNWAGFLDGTQKTLGVINQAIPIVNQVKPMISNARTMFRIVDEMRKPSNFSSDRSSDRTSVSTNTNTTVDTNTRSNTNISTSTATNKPVFYI